MLFMSVSTRTEIKTISTAPGYPEPFKTSGCRYKIVFAEWKIPSIVIDSMAVTERGSKQWYDGQLKNE